MALSGAEATERMNVWGFEPLEPFEGRYEPWRVKCRECGREMWVKYRNVQKGWRCPHTDDLKRLPYPTPTCLRCGERFDREPGSRKRICGPCRNAQEKTCRDCERTLPMEKFPMVGHLEFRRRGSYCFECARLRRHFGAPESRTVRVDYSTEQCCADCGQVKPALDFYLDKRMPSGLTPRCRDCLGLRQAADEAAPLTVEQEARFRERKAASTAGDPLGRKRGRLRAFHMTISDYEAKLERQKGVCASCGEPETAVRKGLILDLSVDHDHSCCPERDRSCGECVRGLLCGKCNRGIGFFDDDVDRLLAAREYLLKWSGVRR